MDRLNAQYEQAQRQIAAADKTLIITHFNPDGDGLSSSCALAEHLKNLGKDYTLYCHTEPPKTFSFLAHIDEFRFVQALDGQIKPELPISFKDYDLIIVLDCGSLSRTRLSEQLLNRDPRQFVIEFDHHPKIDDYADLEIRQPEAAATAELIYQFFKANHVRLTKTIANTLVTGLITDTANFLYPSTSEKTVSAAADLVRMGAQLPRVAEQTLRNKSLEAMKLWGRIMANLQINPKYNIAFTVMTSEEFENNNIDKDELDGVSGFLSNLYGVSAILFLRDEGDGILRGSLRTSHPKVDVSKLARLLSGGGHPKASGFAIKAKLLTTKNGWKVI